MPLLTRKLIYSRSTGVEEPGVLALLAFGSISGTVGATSVYPLNLVRTRLQASGSPGHPQRYKNLGDVVRRTMQQEGWRGFYRGLVPTLAKVRLYETFAHCGLTNESALGCASRVDIVCSLREQQTKVRASRRSAMLALIATSLDSGYEATHHGHSVLDLDLYYLQCRLAVMTFICIE